MMSAEYRQWIGRRETHEDVVTRAGVARFKAALDYDAATDGVPNGFHWCLGLPQHPTQALGEDGHPPLGGFMPPVDLPRRMWAASEMSFLAPLRCDKPVTRHSCIKAITPKSGKSGDMVFVEVTHETDCDGVAAVMETQTIVYRQASGAVTPLPPVAAPPDLSDWPWQACVTPTAQLLFRYSALTFNTHRIHYDGAYATGQEGYPALVVHGPLTASLLLKLCATHLPSQALAGFSYRAKAPLFVDQPLYLAGRQTGTHIVLCAFGADGRIAVEATAVAKD